MGYFLYIPLVRKPVPGFRVDGVYFQCGAGERRNLEPKQPQVAVGDRPIKSGAGERRKLESNRPQVAIGDRPIKNGAGGGT